MSDSMTGESVAIDFMPESILESLRGSEEMSLKYEDLRDKLTELMVYNPRERFGLPTKDSFSIWRLDEEFTVNPDKFISMGKATPFSGMELFGKNLLTVKDGTVIYQASNHANITEE